PPGPPGAVSPRGGPPKSESSWSPAANDDGHKQRAHRHCPGQAVGPIDVSDGDRSPGAKDASILDRAVVRVLSAEPDVERAGERRLDDARIRPGISAGIAGDHLGRVYGDAAY